MPEKALRREVSIVDRSELSGSRTAFSSRMLGRIRLLGGNYEQAIETYRLGALRFPADPNLKLELAIGFALRAQAEQRPLDYERALEAILSIEPAAATPEILFDTALLFEQVPMPQQAVQRWEHAVAVERSKDWREEAEERLADLKHSLQAREELIEGLTASPSSYLALADRVGGSVELVVEAAIANWLPRAKGSTTEAQALARLASDLESQRHDPWLYDLLATTATGTAAFRALSDSWNANAEGDHLRAEHFAVTAEHLFGKSSNFAGALRSRVEYVYALDRLQQPAECMRALVGLRASAHSRHYSWIEGESWLEEITCRTETRKADVIKVRNQAYEWISRTGYEVLRLRALSFLTEEEVSFGSRLSIWARGREGLESFWSEVLPPRRGYTFYYTMADSARAAGDQQAALSLLHEGVLLLEKSPHRQLLALVLSHLADWESGAGLYANASNEFSQMETLFAQSAQSEEEPLWREAEIMRANSETAAGQAERALSRLKHLLRGANFPFPGFSPAERWRLLPALGDAYLALGNHGQASRYYGLIIGETVRNLQTVRDIVQSIDAQREIEAAWRGITDIQLLQHEVSRACRTWEEYRAGSRNSDNVTFSSIPEDTTVLIYAFLPTGLSAWAVHGTKVHQRWLNVSGIKAEVERFSALVANPDSPFSEVRELGKRLYALLIQPLRSYLVERGFLIIDADGPLTEMPWSALVDEQGAFLVDRLAISQVSGWPKSKRQAVDLSRPLIVADPALGSELAGQYGPLPDARHEAMRLQGALPHSVFIHDQGATLSAVSDFLPKSTLLHFGGHGISYGGFGALLLASEDTKAAPARMVTAAEIGGMNLRSLQLVVLAACSSGAGEQTGSVDLDSLVQSFLRAGAPRVVAARWNVNSPETADIMDEFYDLILRGQFPAEALRSAAAYTSSRDSSRHPYYWAGFQLFGSP